MPKNANNGEKLKQIGKNQKEKKTGKTGLVKSATDRQIATNLMRNSVDFNENIIENRNEQINQKNIGNQQINRHRSWCNPSSGLAGVLTRLIAALWINIPGKYLRKKIVWYRTQSETIYLLHRTT